MTDTPTRWTMLPLDSVLYLMGTADGLIRERGEAAQPKLVAAVREIDAAITRSMDQAAGRPVRSMGEVLKARRPADGKGGIR